MRWKKIGFVKVPRTGYDWMHSHCQLPVGMPLSHHKVRVFFASRTAEQRSHIGFVEISLNHSDDTFTVDRVSDNPVLTPGPIGFFDEHGVYPSCIVRHAGQYYLYYIGWNQGVEAPLFYANIGLAVSEDGLKFKRVGKSPILSRGEYDPCLVTSPHVYIEDNAWRMTYVSGFKWERDTGNGKLKSYYDIKCAESDNGFDWHRTGKTAIGLKRGESNIARSAVEKFGPADYRMWYSYVPLKTGTYRIGYASSQDGFNWVRRDELAGIGLDNVFAKEMICYPNIFKLKERLFMLYNGDQFGKFGFGIAVL